jgi:hypothetical protein
MSNNISLDDLGATVEERAAILGDALDKSLSDSNESVASVSPGIEPSHLAPETYNDLDVDQFTFTSADVYKYCKESLDFLAATLMPLVFEFCFPPVFKAVWSWLLKYAHTTRTFPQLALGLPRGFGKTTLLKVFIVYCILFTNRRFILITSATATLAENILSDVIDMLNEPNIVHAFGDWKIGIEKDTTDTKKFGYRGRNIILAAIGAEGSLRGLNLKNERPDVMIFDDIQTKECADSEIQSNKLEEWMIGTAMKAKSPKGCMYLFVGNMYPTRYSILRKLKHNPKWIKFITGGIQADGTSLWEELQPIDQLMNEFENDFQAGHPEIFYSEVLNDENAAVNSKLDTSALPSIPYTEGEVPAGNFIVVDPSNDKAKSDDVSIGYFEVHGGSPVLVEVDARVMSPGDTIRVALEMGLRNNCRLIICESNAFQYSLLYWFEHIAEQMQLIGFFFEPIYSGVKNKNSRIVEMFSALKKGETYLHPNTHSQVFPQIKQFNPLKRDNIDGILDLLTYAPRVIQEYAGLIQASSVIGIQEFEAIPVDLHNSAF